MRYLKLLVNEFNNENRDKRELSVAQELGYEVCVIDRTLESADFGEIYEGFNVWHISSRRLGKSEWLHIPNRGFAFISCIIRVIKTDADVISGHDYIATLMACIANVCKRKKAKIIYDSHEFELYRYTAGRTKFQQLIIKLIEGYLLRHVDLSLMVGDKIADGVQEIYGLPTRPTVIRNIPPYWALDPDKSAEIRSAFLKELELSEGVLLMYHGGIMSGRGIEYAIRALSFLPEDIGLVIMGHTQDDGYFCELCRLAKALGVVRRVLFKSAVPIGELRHYIGAADVEMVLIEGRYCRSYEYSLPNKFFESIQSCTPVICTNLPEIGKIVRRYDIGLLVPENDEKSVAEVVLRLREDQELYAQLKWNMEKAKKELCWEKESLKLKEAICEVVEGTCAIDGKI